MRCLLVTIGHKSDNVPPLLKALQWFLIPLKKSKLCLEPSRTQGLWPRPSPLTSSQVTPLLANLPSSPFCSLSASSSFASWGLTLVSPPPQDTHQSFLLNLQFQQKGPSLCPISVPVLFYAQHVSPLNILFINLMVCVLVCPHQNSSSTRKGPSFLLSFRHLEPPLTLGRCSINTLNEKENHIS